jgi:PEP-CTERM/exosortase A-associated glycosyltransferase
MRVLHVLDISLPMLAGYTSRSRSIVQHQRALGIEPIVLTSERQHNPQRLEIEVIDGIRHHRTLPPTASTTSRPFLKEALEIRRFARRIAEVARSEQCELIHAHSSILCGIPGWIAARRLAIPAVYEIRAFWEDAAVDAGTNEEGSLRYRAIRAAETRLAKRADALIGICEGIKTELMLRGVDARDVFVVPNGVDTERFRPAERDGEIARKYGLKDRTVVAYIGTFAAFEGVPTLIEALVRIMKSGRDDVRGLIVGEGATYEACRAIAKHAGLEDKIIHPGKVAQDEVRRLYSVADILAYPRERARITDLVTPLKPLEAMAMEKAVIGSDVGGLLELIEDGKTGLIFRHADASDLADKILELAGDADLRRRLGRTARAHVVAERNWGDIIARHREVYDRAFLGVEPKPRWRGNAPPGFRSEAR